MVVPLVLEDEIVNVSQALDDVKAFLENDPLVQAAVNLVVPPSTRSVLADVIKCLRHVHCYSLG